MTATAIAAAATPPTQSQRRADVELATMTEPSLPDIAFSQLTDAPACLVEQPLVIALADLEAGVGRQPLPHRRPDIEYTVGTRAGPAGATSSVPNRKRSG